MASTETRQLLAPDPAQQLVVLARVPADLVDDEARARLDLLPQLEVLRHHLALAPLVVRDDAAEEEVRPVEPRLRPARVRQPLVHLGEEAEQADRVDVEHRSREPLVPRDRVVAGEREDVVEPLRAELPAATLERVAVPVLAGEMDDHLLAARDQIGPERVGREHRVPARVVGDREHVDARVGGELPRHLHHPAAAVRRDQPAARDHLGRDDERAGLRELFAERSCRRRISSISLPDLSSPHGRPAGARRRDGPDGGTGLRRDRPRLGPRASCGLRRCAAGADGRGAAGRRARRVRVRGRRRDRGARGTPEFL